MKYFILTLVAAAVYALPAVALLATALSTLARLTAAIQQI